MFGRPPPKEFEPLFQTLGRKCIPVGPIYIDMSFKLYMFALRALLMQETREEIEGKVEKVWNNKQVRSDHVIMALSVRSIFDLWLTAKNFPPKSQIILSAINIPDMIHVIKHHQLVPVPVDISVARCEPNYADIEKNINERTVAILVAHIYGCHFPMEPVLAIAKQHNLQVIEDQAEAFAGLEYTGHPDSDLSLYSFGTIKTASALGGAVGRVKDQQTFMHMRLTLASWPHFTHLDYFKKILKLTPLTVFIHSAPLSWLVLTIGYQLGFDYQTRIVSMVRGFPKDKLMTSLRRQAPVAMLRVLEKSLSDFSSTRFAKWNHTVDVFVARLRDAGVVVPGADLTGRTYWLFPIVVSDPTRVQQGLECLGVSSSVSATQLQCTPLPSKLDLLPQQSLPTLTNAPHMLKHILYLPVNQLSTPKQLDRIADCVIAVVNATETPPPRSKL